MRTTTLALIVTCLAGCATLTQDSLNQRFGAADLARFDVPAEVLAGGVSYSAQVRPILERRCIACHGCYDAPCQLKLGSWQGLVRGTTKALVYDAARLTAAPTTRLFVDAHQASQWRGQGFDSVLNERSATPENQLAASVLYRSLALKRANPLPAGQAVLAGDFDSSLDRDQTCPNLGEYDAYERKHPQGGMPYGLPALSPQELDVITRWLLAGAPDDPPPPLPAQITRQMQAWESFLNGGSRKEQLMSRYLYEHLFLGHLEFDGDAQRHAFRIVRSAAAPGAPIVPIATRRPYDDPGAARVYYRLEPERETLLAKTHMPYLLSPSRMAKLRGWFIDAPFGVDALPSYDVETAANPFIAFAAIPPDSRYRFLLDEAEYFIMNFIKGPVCRGQMALDVIEDRFWVFFIDPNSGADASVAELLARQAEDIRLPAAQDSDSPALRAWRQLARSQERVLAAKSAFIAQRFAGAPKLDLSTIWDGDARNPNAALTVFRHFNSASVVKGLVGDAPKTAWVIGYPLLERIYYLLAAGYDPYGNVGHQLTSRLYMDFMRMEGESNFLSLLPKAVRETTRDFWYRGASEDTKAYVGGSKSRIEPETDIEYKTSDPQRELYGLLAQHLRPVLETRFDLASEPDAALRRDLQALAAVRGASLSWLPEASFLRVEEPARAPRYYSLLVDTGHTNVATLLREKDALRPEENTLTVAPGFIGAYPNAMWHLRRADLPALTAAVKALASEADYRALADRFVIRRTSPDFWAASDALTDAYAKSAPREAALFDLSRLDNR